MEKASLYLKRRFVNEFDSLSTLFIINNFNDFVILEDFIDYKKIEMINIYNNLKVGIIEKPNCKYKVVNDTTFKCELCICLSDPMNNNVSAIIDEYKPKKILFFNNSNCLFSFKIWEKYKKNCNELEIVSKNAYDANRVLLWANRNTEIELSVVLPVYNVEKYLDECISNLSKSNYIEYIFVDDGSTDNSKKIIQKYAKNNKNIIYVYKENGGCASARQFGVNIAKGRYVGFVDPDDFTDKRMFEELLATAMSGTYDVAYCGYNEYYNETKNYKKKIEGYFDKFFSNGVYDKNQIVHLISGIEVGLWRGIYSKKLIKNNNIIFFESLKRFDDLPFKCLIYLFAESVISLPKYYYYYRLNRPGQDVSCNGEKLFVHFEIFELLDKYFLNQNESIFDEYLRVIKNTHSWALSKLSGNLKRKYKKYLKIANLRYK